MNTNAMQRAVAATQVEDAATLAQPSGDDGKVTAVHCVTSAATRAR